MYEELFLEIPEEYQQIKESVHDYAKKVVRPAALQLDKMSADEAIKSQVYWNAMKKAYELGYQKAFIPAEYGGLGLDALGVHILLEELGWGSSSFAVSIGVAGFPAMGACLFAGENQALLEKFVDPLVEDREGRYVGCWPITEPDHGSDWVLGHIGEDPRVIPTLKAKRQGAGYVLNGQKSSWVSNAPIATHGFTFLGIDSSKGMRGNGVCLIPFKEVNGITRGKPLDKMGQRALPQGELFFDETEIPEEFMVVDNEEVYFFAIESVLATANAAMGAMFTGVARAAFEEALRYTRERVQGGVPIHKHQAVQLKLFEMFKRVETARAYSRIALCYNFNTIPPKTRYSIVAKTYCTEAAFLNAHDAIQLYGGMGISKETDIEMIFRDAKLALIEDGTNDSLALAAALSFDQLNPD